jgi:farnesol dehydrogenase
MMATANVIFFTSRVFQRDPLVTPSWVERYLQHRRLSSVKAETHLGYRITTLNEGMKKTLLWLKKNSADEG